MTKHPWAPRGREKAEKKKEMPLVVPYLIFFSPPDPKLKEILIFLDERERNTLRSHAQQAR